MRIPEIIAMLERRITRMQSLRSSYEALGDIEQVDRLTSEIEVTQASINQLRTLPE